MMIKGRIQRLEKVAQQAGQPETAPDVFERIRLYERALEQMEAGGPIDFELAPLVARIREQDALLRTTPGWSVENLAQ